MRDEGRERKQTKAARHFLVSSPSSLTPRRDRFDNLLLRIVDGSLAGCIFVLPFLLGGRHALGQLLLVTLAVAAALAWTVRQWLKAKGKWRWSAVELLLLAGVGLLVMQTVALPQSLLARLAPHTAEILPLWTSRGGSWARLGVWSTISLTPAATQAALVLFLAYCMLFLVAVQRIWRVEHAERLLEWCALSAVLTAAFGLLQFFTSNGKYFWVYEHPFARTSDVPKAAFGNRNHFAHFLALGLGPLIWWFQHKSPPRAKQRSHRFGRSAENPEVLELGTTFRIVALGIVLFALLLSLSRGGAVVTCLAAAISLAVCYRAKSVGIRFVAGLGAAVLLIGVSLAIFGHDRVSDRLGELACGSVETLDKQAGRRNIWIATAKAIPDYRAVGSGVGSLREVYPMYLESTDYYGYYSHAENGYLQVALETGMTGLGLMLTGIGVCGFWCIAGLRSAASNRVLVCLGAVAASLAASVVHSLVDFVWYNPACMALVAILAACACRLWQLTRKNSARPAASIAFPRPLCAVAAVALLAVGGWMINSRIGPVLAQQHWVRFQRQQRAVWNTLASHKLQIAAPDEGFPTPGGRAFGGHENACASLAAERNMAAELETVVRWDPDHARAHLQLAGVYLRLFHHLQQDSVNVMPLSQIRDAAIRSQFSSRRALDEWLSRAVGDHYSYLDLALKHTRRALSLCPLHGEGYLYLGELCFLEGMQAWSKTAYVAQALKVRPFDGNVLFHAGKEAWLAGDYQQWLLCWQRSFRCGRIYQRQMIDWLAGRTRPETLDAEIRFFLEAFQPDLYALEHLYHRYREIARPEQMAPLQLAYAQALESEAENLDSKEAAGLWLKAVVLYSEMQTHDRALLCARKALACDRNSFPVRRELARCLIDDRQLAEAEEHLNWCLKRKPGDRALEKMLRQVVKQRLDRQSRTAQTGRSADYLR